MSSQAKEKRRHSLSSLLLSLSNRVPFDFCFYFLSLAYYSLSNSMIHVVIIVSYLPLSNRAHYSTQKKTTGGKCKSPNSISSNLNSIEIQLRLPVNPAACVCALHSSRIQLRRRRRRRRGEIDGRNYPIDVCVTAVTYPSESGRDRHDITSLGLLHTATDQKVTHGPSPFLFSPHHTTALAAFTFLIPFCRAAI